ncbi:MAG: DUF1844 domain-containing protein [Syntrophus sp. (in: bacteria)]|nr:DUF1844 domain-containing protein [Syntrophus sp. (in: bacteria)]
MKNSENNTASNTCEEDIYTTTLAFSTFLLSLSTSAIVCLGELPDPLKNEKSTNIPLAKQTIGIIEMLKEKTKGNLTEEEDRLIESILYDLRMKYIQIAC